MLFLGFSILFVFWLAIRLKSSYRHEAKQHDMFWKTESMANKSRKKSLEDLHYIQIPFDALPMQAEEEEAQALEPFLTHQTTLQTLATKKIVNLFGQSNTELKLNYGAANLDVLSEYDQNFTQLARTLYQWGDDLAKVGKNSDAISVLEFGIACKTDISKHYTLLASLYKETGEYEKINTLILAAKELNCIMKPSIIKHLHEIDESCHNPE